MSGERGAIPREELGCSAGLSDALRRWRFAARGPATEADRPPASTFPMTPAARAARRADRAKRRGQPAA